MKKKRLVILFFIEAGEEDEAKQEWSGCYC
jgi:hypothetical protein